MHLLRRGLTWALGAELGQERGGWFAGGDGHSVRSGAPLLRVHPQGTRRAALGESTCTWQPTPGIAGPHH